MNSKYRKLLDKIPKELSEVLGQLKYKWKILSYRTEGPGWHAEVEIKGRKFRFNSEYFYINISEHGPNGWESIPPPEDQRISITGYQVAELVNAEFA